VTVSWDSCAPGHGKGPWDGLAAVVKSWLRKIELEDQTRVKCVRSRTTIDTASIIKETGGLGLSRKVTNPFEAFLVSFERAEQWVKPLSNRSRIDKISCYYIPGASSEPGVNFEHPNVLSPISRPAVDPAITYVPGLKSNFQWRAVGANKIAYRHVPCWCTACLHAVTTGNWENCKNADAGQWTYAAIKKAAASEARRVTRHGQLTTVSNNRRNLHHANPITKGKHTAFQSHNDPQFRWWVVECEVPPYEIKRAGGRVNVGTDFEIQLKPGWYMDGKLYARSTSQGPSTFVLQDITIYVLNLEGLIYCASDMKLEPVGRPTRRRQPRVFKLAHDEAVEMAINANLDDPDLQLDDYGEESPFRNK
jgi:hypothetical protein